MARVLHTAVGDEIRRVAQTDPERAAEMRMEPEYAAEVRGDFDYDQEPDYDDGHPELEPDEDGPDPDEDPERWDGQS